MKTYRLMRAPHNTLPTAVFAYALAEYLANRKTGAQAVSLEDLSFAVGAPGRVFCLSEHGLLRRLEEVEALTEGRRGC